MIGTISFYIHIYHTYIRLSVEIQNSSTPIGVAFVFVVHSASLIRKKMDTAFFLLLSNNHSDNQLITPLVSNTERERGSFLRVLFSRFISFRHQVVWFFISFSTEYICRSILNRLAFILIFSHLRCEICITRKYKLFSILLQPEKSSSYQAHEQFKKREKKTLTEPNTNGKTLAISDAMVNHF